MRNCTRFFVSMTLAAGLAATSLPSPASAFTSVEQKCRASVSKSGDKYAKTALKAMTTCHKKRDADAALSGTDCNDIGMADSASKVPAAETKFDSTVSSKCVGVTPSAVSYENCPAPCNILVPAITTFSDVVDCLVCLADDNTEGFSETANGSPSSPPLSDPEAACHSAIVKNGSKFYNKILKAITKCQSKAEKDGATGITTCANAGFDTMDLYDSCFWPVYDTCMDVELPNATLGACADHLTDFDLAQCVCDAAKSSAQELGPEFFDLTGVVTTTTTTTTSTTSTTSTTNTTVPGLQDPKCPDFGELTLYSRDSLIACTSNTDCTFPRTCNTSIGYCTTVADLDSGWTGNAHDSDINDGVVTRATLICPGPAPACGECAIGGIDSSTDNCRCSNNSRTVCDDAFAPSSSQCPTCVGGSAVVGKTCTGNTDCNFPTCIGRCTALNVTCVTNADCTAVPGSGSVCSTSSPSHSKKCANGSFCSANSDCLGSCTGTASCECFFGAPFPLNSAGTAVCVVNRFANDISGTANVDLGSGDITANLRTRIYLGITQAKPCPVCGGKCSQSPTKTCANNSDCVTPAPGGTCGSYDSIPSDGIRGGTCSGGVNTGLSCDASATNATFPARTSGGVAQLPGGGSYSLDCMPSDGANVSGTGLVIDLEQSTGTSTLPSTLDCDAAGAGTDLCPCLQCSKDKTRGCSTDAQCATQGRFCSAFNDPTTFNCTTNSDCTLVNTGTCTLLSGTKCSNAATRSCSTNADCGMQFGGACTTSTCSSPGIGDIPQPNKCTSGLCEDIGDGFNGRCTVGPDQGYCDGLLRIDGSGMNACASNSDCTNGDHCTLSQRRLCFLDPIVAVGDPDPSFPVAGSVFCVPPTEYPAINTVAGLPGPGRVISQGSAKTFCHNDHNVQYTPGGSPACP